MENSSVFDVKWSKLFSNYSSIDQSLDHRGLYMIADKASEFLLHDPIRLLVDVFT